MAAAKAANLPPYRPKGVAPTGTAVEALGPKGSVANGNTSLTRAEAARAFNIDVAGVVRARTVLTKGIQELHDLVDAGQATVRTAADVAALPPEEQLKAVAAGPKMVAAKAKEVRDARAKRPAKPSPAEPEMIHVAPGEDVTLEFEGKMYSAKWTELDPSKWTKGSTVLQVVTGEPLPDLVPTPARKEATAPKVVTLRTAKQKVTMEDEPMVVLAAYSVEWCYELLKQGGTDHGTKLMMDWAGQGKGWGVKRSDAPTEAETDVMRKVDFDSDAFRYWDEDFKRRTGRPLPRPIGGSFYLPLSPEGQ
jgi:hypothetical protein